MKILQELSSFYGLRATGREVSYYGAKAGDIIMFSYIDSIPRLGLVVKSDRAPNGTFLSTRNNYLINVVLLDSISASMLNMLVNTLYKNRVRCSYKGCLRIIGAFVGKDSFRTFKLARMKDIINLEIN